MHRVKLQVRSAAYHWRMNLAVALGVAVAGAALTGALLVGDSMRASLRDVALGRLGNVDDALVAPRYFTEELAARLSKGSGTSAYFKQISPVILQTGGATNATSGAHAEDIHIIGIRDDFWKLGKTQFKGVANLPARSAVINQALADELGIADGGDLLIRLGKPADVSTETLLGRRDQTTAALRLPVHAVIPNTDLGAFSIRPQQTATLNVYVPLETLQRTLDKRGRVNAVLVSTGHGEASKTKDDDLLGHSLHDAVTVKDLGITLRSDQSNGYVALETDTILVAPAVERAAMQTARDLHLTAEPVLSYLANRIEPAWPPAGNPNADLVPYSTIVAIREDSPALARMHSTNDGPPPALHSGEIILNDWAAKRTQASPGDSIAVTYFVTGDDGRLATHRHEFKLSGVVALAGPAADPGWVPPYPGITDTENLADWNAPFPIDFSLVHDADEAYWHKYHTAPKAYVSLEDGQQLWAHDGGRLGNLTSIRFYADNTSVEQTSESFRAAFLKTVDVKALGLHFDPVRQQAIDASQGSTDFGQLFIGFSFFLIISAAMLVALLFRLGVERRCSEVGLLLAVGYTPRRVSRFLLMEGTLIAAVGALVGLAAAQAYAWLMLAGLRTWWSSAANAPFLKLHVTPLSFGVGYVSTVAVAVGSIAWSMRGLTKQTTRSLLAGEIGDAASRKKKSPRWPTVTAAIAGVLAVVCALLPAVSPDSDPAMAFFGSGSLVLIACLAAFTAMLRRTPRHAVVQPGTSAVIKLGTRNAPRNITRSVLTAGLVASATFLIASLQAFRIETSAKAVEDRSSGVGGFALMAESAVPLPYDLANKDNAEALNLSPQTTAELADAKVISFRLKPGDNSSCLSLYKAKRPRILGAPKEMIDRGGFSFSATLAENDAERANPWLLLDHTFDDGAIPVIGDDSAVLWLLHSGLGKDFIITDEHGRQLHLRFVALLTGSVLRNELIISEPNFKKLFPSRSGPQFFLIDTSAAGASDLEVALERDLAPFCTDVTSTTTRLNEYLAVQNTYLSTFQTLGGLGLVLGTLGLAAVMLRNVWERRKELALLRAVGFSRGSIGLMVLSENTALLLAGLVSGCLAAAVGVAPTLAHDPGSIGWPALIATLLGVLAFGLGASALALIPALRGRMIDALRSE